MKQLPRMMPIHINVCAAFFDSGFLNAGTPLLTASTPDSATAPEENARSSMSSVRLWVPFDSSTASSLTSAGLIGSMFLKMKMRTKPTTISSSNEPT